MTGEPNKGNRREGSLSANTILLNRYKILGVLGGGGMGTVYQARDLNFPDVRRLVAVKEMHTMASDRALRESTLSTFRREANILATLTHPTIPQIFDFFDQNDKAYLVMEYINGNDLEQLMSRTKVLPIEKIIEWAIDICEVLNYLHNQQPSPIIFRDIKPSNIMIDSHGKVRLIDFGIAKSFVSGVKNTMIGTEGYSAPEQYKGDISPLSDMYSLGATLHHLLTRRDPRLEPPFSFNERPIKSINPDVSGELIAVIEKSLQFNPKERFGSLAEMGQAIKQATATRHSMVSMNTTNNPSIVLPTVGLGDKNSIQPKWVFKTEDEVRGNAVYYGNMVFVGSYDTNLWAIDATKGEMIWKVPTNGGIASSPVVDIKSGVVLFGSEDYTFRALDYKTGRTRWSFETKDRIRSSPIAALEHVFFGSDDGYLYALVSATGRKIWQHDAESAIRTRPFITDELIVFGTAEGEVRATTLSGEKKWVYRAKRDINSSPVVNTVDGFCYVGSHDGFLYCLDMTNGYSSWRFRSNGAIISTPVLYEDTIVFGSVDKHIYAVNTTTSKERWRVKTEEPIVSSPVLHNDNIYIGGVDGYLYCINVKTGKEKWKFKAGAGITATPLITQDSIIFGSLDHNVYALPLFD
ncbi:MAG: PQQ-binding-like beta-propeller repeat protein [Phototrophicaceae bacterium]